MLRAPPSESRPQQAREPRGALQSVVAWTRRAPKAWLIGLPVGALVLFVAVIVAFAPIVRSRVVKEGAKRRLDVTVGKVRPGFFAVSLQDVHVRLQGVNGVEVRLDAVRVDLTAGLSVKEITGKGGEITIDGEPEEIVERIRAFQKDNKASPTAEKARHTPIAASGMALTWKMPAGGEITGAGLAVARDEQTRLSCASLSAKHGRETLEVLDGDVELGADGALHDVTAKSVTIGREPAVKAVVAVAPPSSAEPALPPLPPVTTKKGAKPVALKKPVAPALPPPPDEPVMPLPDLHAVRARIQTLAQTFGTRVPDGSKFDIGGLSAKIDIGGEPFAFGPGPFVMNRQGDVIRLSFASEKVAADSTPLSVDAELPLTAGDVTAHLSGGPVSLAALGVKEGTKGLLDVGKGTVSGKGLLVLSAAGDALTFDGQLALHAISVKQPRLSGETLRGLDLAVGARGLLSDQGLLRIDDAQLDMGALHVRTHGTIEETTDHFGVALNAEVAPASCQALLDSTPQGLLPTVRTARMSGTFSASTHVAFDTRTIDKLTLDYTINDQCRMVEVPHDLSRDRFSGSFTYRTYHPDGTPSETTTGPGTNAWTSLDDISPFMMAAVLTTEDGAFYKHHGFNHNAIKNSVAANLKARRFVRGASTITMQLAKNLFLSREKTLSRKIEEVILTDYLEQEFRKDDMMELYLNVIEFGPDIYGVTRAAEYYFGRRPEELSLPEAFFLASIMPSPIRYGRQRDRAEVSEGWLNHLQRLMEIAAKNHKISGAELTEGQAQPVVFHHPGDPRPEPRKAVSAGRRDPNDEDAAWQPLE